MNVAERRQDAFGGTARETLEEWGFAPHEADAAVAIGQTHLSDWALRGGLAA